ncbi:uncharacterized protein LOC105632412 isoform X2 [Jatropha curcas]|uniref:uncharacterized protein LOC105632412 isoform X2 n=1 Tax=Jatropha curcas TaxID=180498 RepID=UPI0005FBB888|nr:uncharacterized protein LOC105632412 isoform X2 [Jatropha curcas]
MTEGITSSLGLFFSKMAMEKAEAIGKCCDNIQWSAGPTQVGKLGCDENSSDTPMKDQECIKEMKEIHAYLDMFVHFLPGERNGETRLLTRNVKSGFELYGVPFQHSHFYVLRTKTLCFTLNQLLIVACVTCRTEVLPAMHRFLLRECIFFGEDQ